VTTTRARRVARRRTVGRRRGDVGRSRRAAMTAAVAAPKEIRLSEYAPFPYAYEEVRARRDAPRRDA